MKKIFLFLSIFSVLLSGSCKKEKEKDKDTKASEDNAFAQSIFENTVSLADEAGYRSGAFTGNLSPACVTVTYDTVNSSNEDTITINFGTTSCVGLDSRSRKGMITIRFTGNYGDSASVHTITFLNYFVDNNKVTGTITVTNNGHNASGKTIFAMDVNGQIVVSSGGTILWYAQENREWTSGENTIGYWDDDIYSITGNSSGSQSTGPTFISEISNPLIRSFIPGCRRHFTKGTFLLSSTDKSLRTVDFGSGTCDDIATVTIDGETYTINLH
jgi:hypothetical protein